jgi:hypothetical protein
MKDLARNLLDATTHSHGWDIATHLRDMSGPQLCQVTKTSA